jgi:hypothetical protein
LFFFNYLKAHLILVFFFFQKIRTYFPVISCCDEIILSIILFDLSQILLVDYLHGQSIYAKCIAIGFNCSIYINPVMHWWSVLCFYSQNSRLQYFCSIFFLVCTNTKILIYLYRRNPDFYEKKKTRLPSGAISWLSK